jgi:hypothetical protein
MIDITKTHKYSIYLKEKLVDNDNGWQLIKLNENNIILNKKYAELEEINILIDETILGSYIFHLTLPLKDSGFSFYKRITDESTFALYLKQYIDYIIV